MGQPHPQPHGGGGDPLPPTMPYAAGPGTGPGGPQGGGRRTGLWVALGCVLLVLVLGFLAVTGGIVLLVRRGGETVEPPTDTAPATVVLEQERFTLTRPASWHDYSETGFDADSDGIVLLSDVEYDPLAYDEVPTQSLTVYDFPSDAHAEATCRMHAVWIGFSFDEVDDAVEVDPVAVGDRELVAYRAPGRHDGQDAVAEIYCADVDGDIIEIVVETVGSSEISPELREILASWEWADAAG